MSKHTVASAPGQRSVTGGVHPEDKPAGPAGAETVTCRGNVFVIRVLLSGGARGRGLVHRPDDAQHERVAARRHGRRRAAGIHPAGPLPVQRRPRPGRHPRPGGPGRGDAAARCAGGAQPGPGPAMYAGASAPRLPIPSFRLGLARIGPGRRSGPGRAAVRPSAMGRRIFTPRAGNGSSPLPRRRGDPASGGVPATHPDYRGPDELHLLLHAHGLAALKVGGLINLGPGPAGGAARTGSGRTGRAGCPTTWTWGRPCATSCAGCSSSAATLSAPCFSATWNGWPGPTRSGRR